MIPWYEENAIGKFPVVVRALEPGPVWGGWHGWEPPAGVLKGPHWVALLMSLANEKPRGGVDARRG